MRQTKGGGFGEDGRMSLRIVKKMRKQQAVYWAATGLNHYGRPEWSMPVEIKCRWEDTLVQLRTPTGEIVTFNSRVYVDRSMSLGDRLKLGPMDSTTPDDPTSDEDTHLIQKFDDMTDLKNRVHILIAYL